MTITATCDSHHVTKVYFKKQQCNVYREHFQWSSSPLIGIGKFAVPIINVLIGTYTFLAGLHVEQVNFEKL